MARPTLLDTAQGLENGAASSLSVSYTVPSTGTNRCAVVFLLGRLAGVTVSAITLGGQALTSAGDNAHTDMMVRCYRLLDPPTGAQTLSCTFSAATRSGLIYFTLQDVDQTTPTRTGAGGTALTTGAITTTIATDLIIAAQASRNQALADLSPSADGTEQHELLIDPAGGTLKIATNLLSRIPDNTSETVTWTLSPNNADWQGAFGVPFIEAAAAAPTPRLMDLAHTPMYQSLIAM